MDIISNEKGFTISELLVGCGFMVGVLIVCIIIYVILHFIVKFW